MPYTFLKECDVFFNCPKPLENTGYDTLRKPTPHYVNVAVGTSAYNDPRFILNIPVEKRKNNKIEPVFKVTQKEYIRRLKNAQIIINNHHTPYLDRFTITDILKCSPQWSPLESLLEDSKSKYYFNFAIPKVLTIDDINQQSNQFTQYRFVLNCDGIIKLGYDNPPKGTPICIVNGIILKLAENGVGIASHAGINNYENLYAAGKVLYNKDIKKFTNINNYSGHYQTDNNSIHMAKLFFQLQYPCNEFFKIHSNF